MKKTFFAAAALVAMVSCNKTLIETPESEFGYIDLGISADTEMEVVTKSGEPTPKVAGDTYRVKLEKKGTDNDWVSCWDGLSVGNGVLGNGWVTYGYLNSNASTLLTVPGGNYRITSENIDGTAIYDDDHANGQMYVMGTTGEFPVSSGKSVSKSIACTIQNSKVVVKKGYGFDTYFKDAEIQVLAKTSTSAGSATTFDMNWTGEASAQTATKYDEVYLPAATSVIWKLTAVRLDNENSTTKYLYTNENKGLDYSITTVQSKCTVIELTPSTDGKGAINITISTTEDFVNDNKTATIDPITGTVVVDQN